MAHILQFGLTVAIFLAVNNLTGAAGGVEPAALERQFASDGQQQDDDQAPHIRLPPKLVTRDAQIDIAGSVWDASAIVGLYVNQRRFTLRADGSFSVHLRLKFGVNKYTFRAVDEWGNQAVKRINVVRIPMD